MEKRPKRPRDANQLAKYVMELATGEVRAETPETEMARRGRVGGLKGGKARAEALTPKERSAIAKQAAVARWKRSAHKA